MENGISGKIAKTFITSKLSILLVFAFMILNGVPFLPAFLVTLILGVVLGAINGFLVMKLRITPVIATLVTLLIFKGLALLIVPAGTSAIKSTAEQQMPGLINDYARHDVLLGLPMAFFVAVALIAVLVIVQRKTILGKYAAAVGGNRTAAELDTMRAIKCAFDPNGTLNPGVLLP